MGSEEHEQLVRSRQCVGNCGKEEHRSFISKLLDDFQPIGGVKYGDPFPDPEQAVAYIQLRTRRILPNLYYIVNRIITHEALAATTNGESVKHQWQMLRAARELAELVLQQNSVSVRKVEP